MKTKMKTIALIALLSALPAQAETPADLAPDEGTRGGGQTMNIDGHPALRDLADKTVCRIMKGDVFQKKYVPGFDAFLGRVEKAHWYLALAMRTEIPRLRFCLSEAPLKKIPADDEDSVTIYTQDSDQLAIRLGYKVYLNKPRFESLPNAHHQEMLFAHEIMHSFLPMNVPHRNENMRSLIATVAEDFDSEDLAVALEDLRFRIAPRITPALEAVRGDLLAIVENRIPQIDLVARAKRLGSVRSGLVDTHQNLVDFYADGGYARSVDASIISAIQSDNVAQLKDVFLRSGVSINAEFSFARALPKIHALRWIESENVYSHPGHYDDYDFEDPLHETSTPIPDAAKWAYFYGDFMKNRSLGVGPQTARKLIPINPLTLAVALRSQNTVGFLINAGAVKTGIETRVAGGRTSYEIQASPRDMKNADQVTFDGFPVIRLTQ